MRPLFAFCAFTALIVSFSYAQEPAAPGTLAFSGSTASETTVFAVKERWQVHYTGNPASVTIEDANGAAIAGIGVGVDGTIYMATGGNYKIRVMPNPVGGFNANAMPMNWHLNISQVGAPGQTVQVAVNGYAPPDMTPVGMGAPVPAGTPSMTITGAPVPGAASAGVAPSVPAPGTPNGVSSQVNAGEVAKMTSDQVAALVLIKGDNGEGTGFLVKTAAGPMLVTNQHVIAANPHLQVTTTGGTPVKLTGLKVATDRDLAMIPIQDGAYSYLSMATAADIASDVHVGDTVITPGNSEGGGVMLPCVGVVKAMGPVKVEISNAIYHGNSGGPILHAKSGKVIGVVTEAEKVDVSNALDQASYNSGGSGINAEMRYFGMRLDNVPTWADSVWSKFQNETEFLREFHERSKCLDSYLNTGTNDRTEWGTYFARDEKVKEANTAYGEALGGNGDSSQRVDAVRTLIFSLDAVADDQMDQIGNPGNFSSYNQQRSKDEAEYRRALKKEIGEMSSNVNRLAGLARPNN